jgi:hypothetical protein
MIPRITTLQLRINALSVGVRRNTAVKPTAVKPGRIQLFDLPNKCDAAIESSSETNVGEGSLHGGEVVGDDEG